MALIKCPECGKDVSDTCVQCIHCGFKLKKESNDYLSKREEYTPRVIIEQKNTDKKVMSLGEAKLCMILGPIVFVGGIWFLIVLLNSSQEKDGWHLFWMALFIFMIVFGIICTVKGCNAYSYHKNND